MKGDSQNNKESQLVVSNREYSALDAIRGMNEKAHYLVMTANNKDSQWILEGPEEAFDALLEEINMEIEEGLAPRKNLPALERLCRRLASDSNPYELRDF